MINLSLTDRALGIDPIVACSPAVLNTIPDFINDLILSHLTALLMSQSADKAEIGGT